MNWLKSTLRCTVFTSFILMLLFESSCTKNESPHYEKEGVAFLNSILDSIRMEYHYIAQYAHDYHLVEDTSLIFRDTLFSKEDLQVMRNQLVKSSTYKWNPKLVKGIKMIPTDTLDYYFKELPEGWLDFHKNYRRGFISCSFPVFNVKKDKCIVQLGFHCGALCGGGEVALFQRRNNQWVQIKTYSSWIS